MKTKTFTKCAWSWRSETAEMKAPSASSAKMNAIASALIATREPRNGSVKIRRASTAATVKSSVVISA